MRDKKEVWPLASYLAEEMQARDWTCVDVAQRMGGDYRMDIGVINFFLVVPPEKLVVDLKLIAALAQAFGMSPGYLHNLHQFWIDNPLGRQPFECPEELLDGLIFPENDNSTSKGPTPDTPPEENG